MGSESAWRPEKCGVGQTCHQEAAPGQHSQASSAPARMSAQSSEDD